MNALMLEPLLRDATIKAIDGVAKKLAGAEAEVETKVTRLLKHWNEMEPADKEHAVGVAIAAVTTVVTAIMALRGKVKAAPKKAAKKAVKAVVKKAFR
jgi:hypothetical protein